ncbi:MAG: InlB B-repeat-containing protein [Paludibacteraceae bacterium]|nr:InlB B-repeat-containing protein [Paludibacteraceae bacterium]
MRNFLITTWITLSFLMLGMTANAAVHSGTSGGTKWTLDTGTGVLTISKGSGTSTGNYCGEWTEYCNTSSTNPWVRKNILTGDPILRYNNITSIVVEEGVTELGTAIFWGLKDVTSVKLPESLTTIGYETFRDCSKLDSIYIPKNVCTLKDRWATDCDSLAVIEIDPENKCFFTDKYGAVYSSDSTTLVKVPQDMTIGELTIIDGATKFATDALYQQVHLTQIRLPESMTTVQYGALDGMKNLKNIYFESEKAPAFENEIGNGTNTKNLVIYIPCIDPEVPGREEEFQKETGISVESIQLFLNTYDVQAVPENQRKGTTQVINATSCEDHTVTIIAKPNPGYNFLRWESNKSTEIITEAEYKYNCKRDEIFTAYFSNGSFQINVTTNIGDDGTTSGIGDYEIEKEVEISASAKKDCYEFIGWMDGVTENPRTITVTADNPDYKAIFEKRQQAITATTNDAQQGSVTLFNETEEKIFESGGYALCNDSITLTATPQTGHHFVNWNGNNGLSNPIYGFHVSEEATYTANFAINNYEINFVNYDGTILQTSRVDYMQTPAYNGEKPTRPATAEYSYQFKNWGDGLVEVSKDSTYIAKYDSTANSYKVIAHHYDKTEEYTYQYKTEATAPEVGTIPEGHIFKNWSDNDINGAIVNFPFEMPAKDTVVHAIFVPDTFTLCYMTHDSVVIRVDSVVFGTNITNRPEVPSREGYSNGKWDKTYPTMIAKNDTILAIYTVNKHTVRFIDHDGNVLSENIYDYNTIIEEREGPTHEGYTFHFWASAVNRDQKVVFPFNLKDNDTTLMAICTINQYNLIFKSDNDTEISNQKVDYNSTITQPAAPTQEGFTFTGWDQDIPSNMPAKDMTFTAQWRINKYTITFDTDGGSAIDAITQDYNSAITVPAEPTKTGYNFEGWTPDIPERMPSEDLTIKANWKINQYTITFDTDGGTPIDAITQDYNTAISAPANPTKTGYTFNGWDTEIPTSMPAEDITIKANWKINQYTITFDTDGGTPIDAITQDYGTTVTIPADPTKEGYSFNSWDKVIPTTIPAENMTIKAQWIVNQYTISFDTDGGTPIEAIKQDYNTAITPPANPTKTGYSFIGWDKEIPTTIPAENMTIKAQWDINQYTITFNTDGGSAIDAITQDYNTSIEAPVNPSKEGYSFEKWDRKIPTNMPAENITITAIWKINQYTISFNTDGGSEIAPITQNYGTTIAKPNNPTKTGYTFASWTPEVPATMPAGDLEIKANWTVNQYTITFNTDGGNTIDAITQDYNTAITTPANPTKIGYSFIGWDKDIPKTMPAENMTINANWDINQYTITFDTDGGDEIKEIKQDYNSLITKPTNPKKEGHTFKDWTPTVPNRMPAQDMTIKANWEINSYTITFYDRSGNNIYQTEVEYNSKLEDIIEEAESELPIEAGREFMGWSNFQETMPSNNLDLQALYNENRYKIHWLDYDGKTLATTEVVYEETFITPNVDLSRTGYTFVNWVHPNSDNTEVDLKSLYVYDSDTSFIANYKINQYTIEFDTDGGSEIASITKDYDTPLDAVSTSKTGYTFSHWTEGEGESEMVVTYPTKMPAKDMKLKANWDINQYTITFDTDGGSKIEAIKQDYNTAITTPANPTKEGYTFISWDMEIPTTMPAENITINAVWEINQYTITFDTDGGNKIEAITQDYGSAITIPADPVKEGHTFYKWNTDIPSKMPASDITITALWNVNAYTMSFDTDGGNEIAAITKDFNSAITAPADPVKVGFTFIGWNNPIPATMPAKDTTFKAKWEINQYTINFDSNGGSHVESITADYNSTLVAPAAPTREGYTFTGWNPSFPEIMPLNGANLKATWTINSHNLTFKRNENEVISSMNVAFGNEIIKPNISDSVGYTFAGWKPEVPTTMPDNAVEIVAQWTINSYQLKFIGFKDEELLSESVEYNKGLSEYIPEVVNPEGWTFMGWEPEIPTTMPAEDLTINAVWERNEHNFSYIVDGEKTEVPYLFGESVKAPTSPVKEGYTFNGWKDENNQKVSFEFSMPDKDTTVTASWIVDTFKVTYVDFDGTVLAVDTVTYGSSDFKTINEPTREGYEFIGWSDTLETMPAEDVTINANYSILKFKMVFYIANNTLHREVHANYGVSIPTVSIPNREGYRTIGWNKEVPKTMPAYNDTFYAVYEIIPFVITYLDYDNDTIGTDTINYGEEITIPENPVREGYTFEQWFDPIPATMPAKNVTCIAQYTINQYNLVFNDFDGRTISSKKLNYNAKVTTPTNPTREGYSFIGWDNQVPTLMPANNVTLNAQYQINTYAVTFVNFDKSIWDTDTLEFGSSVNYPETNPNRKGYTFIGWSDSISIVPAKDSELKALYEINAYTITFKNFDGSIVEATTLNYGEKVVVPANPTREGHTFIGWDTTYLTMPAEDVEVIAQYSINSYTITYKDYDKSVITTSKVAYNEKTPSVENPKREGYTFSGWNPSVPETMPAKNFETTAQYKANTYSLLFRNHKKEYITRITDEYGKSITAPQAPSIDGHKFIGWNKEIPATMPAYNDTFYAKYQVLRYSLTFMDKESQTIYQSDSLDFGSEVKVPESPEKEGYTFAGWDIDVPAVMPSVNIIIYATWSKNHYALSYYGYDSTLIKTDSIVYNEEIEAIEEPTREGHSFIGWEPTLSETMPANDIDVYATYTANKYQISFLNENDEVLSSDSVVFGDVITTPSNPEREGYKFSGWNPEIPETMPANDVVVKATWTKNVYSITFVDYDETVILKEELGYEEKIVTPNNPTREGYSFIGWNPNVPKNMPSKDLIITAEYLINKYEIAFLDDNNEVIYKDSVEFGESIELPANPEKEGHSFNGWEPTVPETMPANDVVVKPTWNKNVYTITFVDYDNSVILKEELEFEQKIKTPNNPTREGYTFTGWDPSVPNNMPNKDLTITANYKVNLYEITFKDDDNNILAQDSLEYGEKIVTPKNPEKAGYEFSGWTPNLPATMPAKDLEVKPNWTELAITLKNIETFTSNLCEGDDAQINFTHEGGKPISFKIIFNEEAVAAGFPKEYDGKIDDDMNIFFTLPSTVEEGSYKASLQLFGASEESNKFDFKFSTNLSSSHLSRMWNDVIVCNNVDKRFTSYQWYKNGEEIPGATNQFYCELGGLNGNYSVKVTSTNGNELFICGLECEYILPPFSISAYPNPAKANEEITLEIEGLTSEELDNAKIFVYNTSGIVAHSNKEVNFKNLVQLPSGSYIGVVELDGKTAFCKFIVR